MRFLFITTAMCFLYATSLLAETPEKQFIVDYAQTAQSQYKNVLSSISSNLKPSLENFLKNPSEINLDVAKKNWLSSMLLYIETEVYRFYGGPIDGDDGPEKLINSWPIDESFIDYVTGALNTGIINRPADYPNISLNTLIQLNELGGNTNISTGFHAIEFLLWGQDQSTTGPGVRPFTDYVTGVGANAERRAQYLRVVVDLLEKSFVKIDSKWTQKYFKYFTAEISEIEALTKIFKGIYKLSGQELAHERMNVPVETQDQEDEHSCFSDTTHLDHIHDIIGLKRVLLGSKGTNGLIQLIASKDKALATDLGNLLTQSEILTTKIPSPFDQAITDPKGQTAINLAVKSLEDLSVAIQKAASLWNIKVN